MRDWSAEIVAIARSQDKAAFSALFLHFMPRLKGYFIRLGSPPGVAEDLAQDVMLSVWKKSAYFDPERASAATWIFTIARNLRIDLHRRERDPHLLADAIRPEFDILPSDQVVTLEREVRIRTALTEIAPDQAQVIRLSYFEEQSHSEIAKTLGIPLGTVKTRVRLAMEKLRTLVRDLR